MQHTAPSKKAREMASGESNETALWSHWRKKTFLKMKGLKKTQGLLTNSFGSRAHSQTQIADWRCFISAKDPFLSLSGNRSFPLVLRAFKHSAEAECSGRHFLKCNLWRKASWHCWGQSISRAVPAVQLEHSKLFTVLSFRAVWGVARAVALWGLCLACQFPDRVRPYKYINTNVSADWLSAQHKESMGEV